MAAMKKSTVTPVYLEASQCPVHEDGVRVELVAGDPVDTYTSSSVGYSPAYTERWASVFGTRCDDAVN